MNDIANRKAILIEQYDDGDITAREYCKGLDAIYQKEREQMKSDILTEVNARQSKAHEKPFSRTTKPS